MIQGLEDLVHDRGGLAECVESCITEKVKLYGKSISQCTTITKSRRHGEDSLPGSERKASEHYLASS